MTATLRFFDEPRQSYFLFGPRGTGKSTWLAKRHGQALHIDLLQPDIQQGFAAHPGRLRELVRGQPEQRVVVIDEIQKCPELLDVVHALIEEHRGLQFVLTGSSSRKLKRTGVDLLAGRALLRTMHPFMAAELGEGFRLQEALCTGLVPLVFSAEQPAETIKGYVGLYVQEEVQAEGLVRRIGPFSRFLEAISFSHGAVLNITNVARECQVKRTTVDSYITILEDLLMAVRLPIFRRRAARATIAHPKFYFFDCGVFRALRPHGPLDRSEEIDGAALEGLVFQHLRAWIAYRGNRNTVYFWRTTRGNEVDFVVYGEDGLFALEVKNAAKVHNQDLKSLKAFRKDYPECRAALLYRGTERLLIDEILCLPCEEFLTHLVPDRTLPYLDAT